jgi:hypothetical protein
MEIARPHLTVEASAPGQGGAIVAVAGAKPARTIRIDPTDHRARRLLAALLHRPRSRLEAGTVAGAVNLPDLVCRLRGLGFDLPCERIEVLDRDGVVCRPGVYSASNADRSLIRRALRLPTPSTSTKHPKQPRLFEDDDGERAK